MSKNLIARVPEYLRHILQAIERICRYVQDEARIRFVVAHPRTPPQLDVEPGAEVLQPQVRRGMPLGFAGRVHLIEHLWAERAGRGAPCRWTIVGSGRSRILQDALIAQLLKALGRRDRLDPQAQHALIAVHQALRGWK